MPLNERLLNQLELPNTKLIIVSGPSLSGKTSLVKTILSEKQVIAFNLKLPEIIEQIENISDLRSSIINIIEILKQEIIQKHEEGRQIVVFIENILQQAVNLRNNNVNETLIISELISELFSLSKETNTALIITTRNYPDLISKFVIPEHHLVVTDFPEKETMKSFIQNIVTQINSFAVTPIQINEEKIASLASINQITIGEIKALLSKLVLAHSSIPEYHLETEDLINELTALSKQKQKTTYRSGIKEKTMESETVEDIMNRLMQRFKEIEEETGETIG